MPRAKRAPEVVEEAPVDEVQETDTLTGAIPEGELEVARSVAKRMGWTPKEEWTRDPSKWEDADVFLENTPKVLQALKERSERTARAAAEAIEDERRRNREEATRVIETSEDPTERKQAAQRLAENAGPPPETQAWMARNPWFQTDPDAQALAVAKVNQLAKEGRSIPDQLAAAEDSVRKRFPEYFAPSVSERTLADVRRQAPMPPQVQSGTRATTTQPRERGFAQIPRADRDAFNNNLLRKYVAKGLTQEQAQSRYAEAYWRDPPEDPSTRSPEPWPSSPRTSRVWVERGGRTR